MEIKRCNHNWIERQNKLICDKCNKSELFLKTSDDGEIRIGIKSNGIKYSVRYDRHRYFFPDEWINFINSIENKKHQILFKTLLFTGARIMEVLHIKPENFDFARETITLKIIKQRNAKKHFHATGKSRTFFVSKKYLNEMKKYIKNNNIDPTKYLFMDNSILPQNYETLENKDRRKYYEKYSTNYNTLFKRKLKKLGIKDWYNFSLHNIRKTYGNWMRSLNINITELCYRLGHDLDTYLIHYGSSLVFMENERRQIESIFGDVKF